MYDPRQNNVRGGKILIQGRHSRGIVFVETTGSVPEGLIGNRYCIGVVYAYNRYSWSFFTKTRSQLPINMEEFFENMMPRGTPVKYLYCNNAGGHQSKLQKACKK